MRLTNPVYIVLEGIDKCGKSTQARRLAHSMYSTELTSEPTNGMIGQLIRKYLKEYDLDSRQAEGTRETLLFYADRIEHHQKFIKPKLEQGMHVISDRSYHSTIAYEGGLGVNVDFIVNIRNRLIDANIIQKPDLTLILDIPVEKALARKKVQDKEKFEEERFLEEVRKIYLNMPKHLPDENIIIMDGSLSEYQVTKNIKKILGNEFKNIYQTSLI